MPYLTILGSSNAIPDEDHENTHMVLVSKDRTVLVDCSGHPLLRLKQIGIDHQRLTDIILTHFHPDHVSGIASFLMNLWLLGRREPIRIYGLEHTLLRTEKMMEFYDWNNWPGFFSVTFQVLPEEERVLVLEGEEIRIYASPVRHIIPTIGLRFDSLESNQSLSYSCDTEPCAQVVRLARESKILIHEASGATYGHSSAAQAGEIAQRAGAERLYLIHYPTNGGNAEQLIEEARSTFSGPVELATDLLHLDI